MPKFPSSPFRANQRTPGLLPYPRVSGRLIQAVFGLVALLGTACVEPYAFDIRSRQPGLVVEGFISTVSYRESLAFPSDGRYFSVKLHHTSDVKNIRDRAISAAVVALVSSSGDCWPYTESVQQPGHYYLLDEEFKAEPGHSYQLQLVLADGSSYASDWVSVAGVTTPMGAIGFEEVTKLISKMEGGKEVKKEVKGVDVYVEVPINETAATAYYRWNFAPSWIFIARLAQSSSPYYRCWVNSPYFLPGYVLRADHVGGYRQKLFFLEIEHNERLFEDFSVLVSQQLLDEDQFYFWQEMQQQVEGNGISDIPPYNLKTNIRSLEGAEKVSGFFGAVDEKAGRWYFNIQDLSYRVENTGLQDCINNKTPAGDRADCVDCLKYEMGSPTNVKPAWWR